jgi:excisionase family DNA binding protein
MSDWIGVTEAAKLTGYSVYHLRDLIRAGTLKAQKVITVWQIDRASLDAYIKKQSNKGRRGPKKRD